VVKTRIPRLKPTWILLILVLLQLGIDAALFVTFPTGGRDFVIQMTAGRVADLDGTHQLYEPEVQLTRQREIRNSPSNDAPLLAFNHPPFLVEALRPLSRLPYEKAYRIWLVCELLLFSIAAYAMTTGLAAHGASTFQVSLNRLAVLSFFSVALALAQGQDTAVLMLGAAGWSVLIGQRRDFTAGVLLSLAAIRPHIALTLAIPFVFARRRVFAGFLAGTVLLGLYSLSLVGWQGVLAYIDVIRDSAVGGQLPMGTLRMPNFLGLLHRVGYGSGGERAFAIAAWMTWVASIAMFSIWWSSLQSRVSPIHCGLLLIGTVFFVPHLHLHDAALLAIPPLAVAVVRISGSRSDWERPAISMLAASLFLSAAGISTRSSFDVKLAVAMLLILAPLLNDLRSQHSIRQDA
jgi:hypothetical protein